MCIPVNQMKTNSCEKRGMPDNIHYVNFRDSGAEKWAGHIGEIRLGGRKMERACTGVCVVGRGRAGGKAGAIRGCIAGKIISRTHVTHTIHLSKVLCVNKVSRFDEIKAYNTLVV